MVTAIWTSAAVAQDQWTWLTPLPQSFYLVSVAFADSLRGLACGSNGALYSTPDAGESWSRLSFPYYKGLGPLVFLDPLVVLAAGQDGDLLWSADGGKTWAVVSSGTSQPLLDIEGKGSLAFAATDGGMLKSTDAGLHWQPVGRDGNLAFSEIHPFGTDTLYALGRAKGPLGDTAYFLKSVDGGTSWSRSILAPEGVSPGLVTLNQLSFPSRDTGYAEGRLQHHAGRTMFFTDFLLKTQDGGAHWSSRTMPDSNNDYSRLLRFRDPRRGLAIVGDSVYTTEDGGSTWNPAVKLPGTDGPGNLFLSSVGLASDSYLAVGLNIALKSSDGAKIWRIVLQGATAPVYRDIHFTDATTGYALTDTGGKPGLFATRNGGKDWAQVPATVDGPGFYDVGLSSLRFSDAMNAVATGATSDADPLGLIYRTADAGVHWKLALQEPGRRINDMRFTAGSTGIAVGDSGVVLKTIDGGAHWTAGSAGTDHNLVSVDFPNPAVGFALGVALVMRPADSLFAHETVILRTEDGGSSWTQAGALTEAAGLSIRFFDTRTGFMTLNNDLGVTSSRIMKTRDGGSTWKTVAEVPGFEVGRIEFQDSANLFAVGGGVYRSRDGGESWSQEAIPAGPAYALHFPTKDAGFLACDGAILKLVPGPGTAIRAVRGRSAPLLLGSDLRYRLDSPTRVSALLFDPRGRQVSVLFEGLESPGTHQLPWPARKAHGSYFLDFRAGEYRQSLPLSR